MKEEHRRLFRGAAPYYLRYRSDYPERLIYTVASRCSVNQYSRVLDLGCGPGTLSRAFAPLCGEVIGIDPEPEMIMAARKHLADHPQVHFRVGSAQELSRASFGTFTLVAIGRAFHWMDRRDTLERLQEMVEPSGAVVLFRDPALKLPENAWKKVFDSTFAAFAANEPAREGAKSLDFAIDESQLLQSAFSYLERVSVVETRVVCVDHLVGRAFSMAGTSPFDLGPRLASFEAALRAGLGQFATEGRLVEITEPQALIAKRPPPAQETPYCV